MAMIDDGIRKYGRPALVALVTTIIAILAAMVVFAPSQGATPAQGPSPLPPLTPRPVPTPTPLVLGNPAYLEAIPTGHPGQVELWWDAAKNATAHWVWSAKWDNTGGKWTPGDWGHAVVDGLENGQDHWFSVIAGLGRRNGEYEWSEWSNWAKAAPERIPTPTPEPPDGIGKVDVDITDGPNGPEAFAITPCDGPPAPVVPDVHGGGSPTGSSCNHGQGANFNLTPLVSSGHNFKIPMACINRSRVDCASAAGDYRATWDIGFVERVRRRTNGQVQFEVTSFPEMGVIAHDSPRLVQDGTLQSAQIHPGYIGADFPIADIVNLWGLYPDRGANLAVIDAVQPAMSELTAAIGGVQVAYMMSDSYYLFSRREVHDDLNDWRGFTVRSHRSDLMVLLSGLGANPVFLGSAEARGALERGDIDGAITCASCGADLGWYKVSDYIVGPLINVQHSWLTVNRELWDTIPLDLQNIILEEGARHAYQNRHLALVAVEPEAVDNNISNGMRYAEFSYWIQDAMRQSSIDNVIPRWVELAGGPHSEAVRVFNEYVLPIVKVRVNSDGSASDIE